MLSIIARGQTIVQPTRCARHVYDYAQPAIVSTRATNHGEHKLLSPSPSPLRPPFGHSLVELLFVRSAVLVRTFTGMSVCVHCPSLNAVVAPFERRTPDCVMRQHTNQIKPGIASTVPSTNHNISQSAAIATAMTTVNDNDATVCVNITWVNFEHSHILAYSSSQHASSSSEKLASTTFGARSEQSNTNANANNETLYLFLNFRFRTRVEPRAWECGVAMQTKTIAHRANAFEFVCSANLQWWIQGAIG